MPSQWPLWQQEEIVGWVIGHPNARLSDCSRYFAIGEHALRELVEQRQFKVAFEQRLDAEWRAGRGNPSCPNCGGRPARLRPGLPNFGWLSDPLQSLWQEAGHYCCAPCDYHFGWRCNQCQHEFNSETEGFHP